MCMRLRSRISPRILLLFVLTALVGCRGGTSSAPPLDTVRVGLEDPPKTLDPRFATDVQGQRISRHLLFSSLVQHGEKLEIVPQLAASWEAPDEATLVLHLRSDFIFHDGRPVTAHDVVATYEHLMDPATASPLGATFREKIATLEATDPHTLRIVQKRPTGSFLEALISPIKFSTGAPGTFPEI